MQFEDDPFNSETTETGNILSDEIVESQQKRCQTLIESKDFTHSSVEKRGKPSTNCRRTTRNHRHEVEYHMI